MSNIYRVETNNSLGVARYCGSLRDMELSNSETRTKILLMGQGEDLSAQFIHLSMEDAKALYKTLGRAIAGEIPDA